MKMSTTSSMYRAIASILVVISVLLFCVQSSLGAEIVWANVGKHKCIIYSCVYKGSGCENVQTIIAGKELTILPTLSISDDGKKIIVWSRVTEFGSNLEYKLVDKNGKTIYGRIITPYATNLAPVVIYDSKHIPWLFWSGNSGGDDDIFMSQFINRKWRNPVRVNEKNDVPDILPEARVDKNGTVWVSWMQMKNNKYINLTKGFVDFNSLASSSLGVQLVKITGRTVGVGAPAKIPEDINATGRIMLFFQDDNGSLSKSIKNKE